LWPPRPFQTLKDLLEDNFLSQAELSLEFNVSQQCISHWLRGVRNPGSRCIPGILEFARDHGIDTAKYKTDPEVDAITDYLRNNKGRELVRIFELYSKMSRADKGKFVRYAEKMKK